MLMRFLFSLALVTIFTMSMGNYVQEADAARSHFTYIANYAEIQDADGNTCDVSYNGTTGPHVIPPHQNHPAGTTQTHYHTHVWITIVDECDEDDNDGNGNDGTYMAGGGSTSS